MAADSATTAVAVAFIIVGILTAAVPAWGGVNWVVGGVLGYLAGWFAGKK